MDAPISTILAWSINISNFNETPNNWISYSTLKMDKIRIHNT
jgi:hypothetical protein